jgi:hypothetical protein
VKIITFLAFRVDHKHIKTRGKKEVDLKMRRIILVLLGLAVILSFPHFVFSDCLDFGWLGSISWHVQDEHTVIFYDGATLIARVDIPYCHIKESSTILLTNRYNCDSDKIIVDDTPCSIMTITSASGGSF